MCSRACPRIRIIGLRNYYLTAGSLTPAHKRLRPLTRPFVNVCSPCAYREAENSLIKISVHLPKLMDTYFDEASTRALDGTGRTLTNYLAPACAGGHGFGTGQPTVIHQVPMHADSLDLTELGCEFAAVRHKISRLA